MPDKDKTDVPGPPDKDKTDLPVPGPLPQEEVRQLAVSLMDLEKFLKLINENAEFFLPGEEVEGFKRAWNQAEDSFIKLRQGITDAASDKIPKGRMLEMFNQIEQSQLTGDLGKAKRSFLGRLKDRFYQYWNEKPIDEKKRRQASASAQDYLEFAGTVVGSIPFSQQVVEVLGLAKQLIAIRHKRDSD